MGETIETRRERFNCPECGPGWAKYTTDGIPHCPTCGKPFPEGSEPIKTEPVKIEL